MGTSTVNVPVQYTSFVDLFLIIGFLPKVVFVAEIVNSGTKIGRCIEGVSVGKHEVIYITVADLGNGRNCSTVYGVFMEGIVVGNPFVLWGNQFKCHHYPLYKRPGI